MTSQRALGLAAILLALSCQSTTDAEPGATGGAANAGAGGQSASAGANAGVGGAASGAGGGGAAGQSGSAASGGAGTAGASATPRDWTANPAILQRDGVKELWVTSDVHGDYATFSKLLAGAGLISSVPTAPMSASWTGGASVLVVVGDLIDKGPDAINVIGLLIDLQSQAQQDGGDIVVTMGNHEAEFLADPANGSASGDDGFDGELTAAGLDPQMTSIGDNGVGAFLRGLPVAARIDGWFFVHAGNTNGATISSLSATLQSGIDANGFGDMSLQGTESVLQSKLHATGAQWWDATGNAADYLASVTSALGATHLVMGHQPGVVSFADGTVRAQDVMVSKYDGRLFLVDTGMSVGVDDTGGALLHVTSAGEAGEAWEEVTPAGKHLPL